MVDKASDQVIVAAWEADGRPVPYPEYKASYLANNGQWQPVSGHSVVSSAPVNDTPYSPGTLADLFIPIAMSGNDGSKEYYDRQTAYIDKQLADPDVTPQKKQELRKQQDQLDAEFLPQRQEAATKTLQGAKTDEEALAALQALEGLRSTTSSAPQQPAGQYINGKRVDPELAKNGPVYDPEDEAQMRREWEQDFAPKGVSFEEYKQMVKAANPDGALRYTSPTAKNLNGTPKTFPGLTDPTAGMPANGANGQTILNNASITQAARLGYFDNVSSRALAELGAKNKATDAESKRVLDLMESQGQGYKDSNNAYVKQLMDAANSANAESRASSDRFTGAVNTANTANRAALDSYTSGIAPYQHEIAGTTRQNVQFDPEGLAAQRESLNQARAIAGGSLDYQSRAAQAYADPADVARALEGINMLKSNATSGGNEQRRNLDIARDEYRIGGVQQQGVLDKALYEYSHGGDNQQEVLNKYRDISTPEMTAAERALLSQSQRQYAIMDKANRDATASDLESRGAMSGAALIAGQQSAQQRLGEERVAGTLGAQAQAVQRALIGLQGMKDTSNDLRTGNQNALALADRAATNLRTGNQNAEQLMQAAANALREGDLAAANAYTVAAQRQREQGFQEEYSRGVAADNASANNQSTRLGGAQLQGQQANAIRSANDAVNMFNNEQQGITDRYNTSFKQSEYQRLTGLQQQTFENKNTTTNTIADREDRLNTANQGAISDRFGRTNTGIQTGIGVNAQNWGIDSVNGGNRLGENQASQGRTEREVGKRIDTAGKRTDLSGATNDEVAAALRGLSPTYRI